MIKINATNEEELKAAALDFSQKNPRVYVCAFTIFQEAYLKHAKSINYNWIGDTFMGGVWKNGKFVEFSAKHKKDYDNKGLCCDR
jgi:hypothetical protein